MSSRASAAHEAPERRLPDHSVEEREPLSAEDDACPEDARTGHEDSGWPGPIDEPPPLLA